MTQRSLQALKTPSMIRKASNVSMRDLLVLLIFIAILSIICCSYKTVSLSSGPSCGVLPEKLAILTIPTEYSESDKRDLHRFTWMQYNVPGLRVVFALTAESQDQLEKEKKQVANVRSEAITYRDMIFVQAVPDGRDLINKTAAIVNWVAQNGSDYLYWIKMDTDTFPHPYNLLGYLAKLPRTGVYMGEDVKGWDALDWGPYMSGGMYVLSTDLVKKVNTFIRGPHYFDKSHDIFSDIWFEDLWMGYTLEQAAAHNHYVTGKDTLYHFEPRQDRWESQRDWWVPTVLGLHPIKEQGNFTACFQHYRLDLVRQQHCYHTNIRKPLGDRIAACSRPLPDLRVRDEYDHRYHLSMLPPEALAAVLKSQKHDDKAKQSVV